jgi:UDP-N-acetylglucosamine--dolichyl-phosphate N-acetylglucosaminephosphotransferase
VTLEFSYERQIEYNAGLLAICLVVLLGFVDDVIDLKWRHKMIVPTVATFPLLMAYKGLTYVVVPKILRPILGGHVDLGFLYYFYMSNIAIFCTNAINIYAGINGIEIGQSFIIGCFIVLNNIIQITLNEGSEIQENQEQVKYNMYSLTIMIPFLFCTLALFKHNKFPS